jgi:hypothetical protein
MSDEIARILCSFPLIKDASNIPSISIKNANGFVLGRPGDHDIDQ